VIRYKANHKNLHQLDYTKYSDAIAIGLKAALKNNENPRPFLDEAAFSDKSKRSKILVEAITYEEGEFNTSNATHEAERLNRPLIPVEAEIYLKSKEPANDKTLAPEAVGAVRVNWRFKDPDEDTSTQLESVAGEPSLTKKYVEKCLKLKSGRSGTNGDNSHKDFKGIREAPDANWPTAFLLGDFYIPHVVEKDAGQKVVFSKACVDAAKFPKRVGRAGVYFRPSYVAGDDYQLKAELDFTGLPNKDDLEKFHEVKDEKSRIHVETGTFFISRFNQVAMVVNWPARTNADEWDKVAAEFLKAHMDVDVGQIASKKMSEVLTKAEYQKIVKDNTTHSDLSKINLEDDSLVGVALPAQGALDAAAYKTTLRTFVHADYGRKIRDDLRKKLSENIRKEHPNGFVIVNFLSHKPVDIKNAPPGDNTVTAANTAFITWSSSVGMADSIILADQKDPDKVYYVVAHEMGHNFWLHHWEHVDVPSPKEHDQKDHNCLMSYSSSACAHPHHVPGTYTPHFCGKCNLKLRGWDIDHADMPDDSD
jgi:hypothetical protein